MRTHKDPAEICVAGSFAFATATPPRPPIVWDPIPFGARRKAETVAYVRRHYGSFMRPTWRLVDPHVIVIHYTDSAIKDVIGHNESLSSPYHREDVAALRHQTHSDFNHADMQVYRARLGRTGPCV